MTQVNLTTQVTGNLPSTNGGTGASNTATSGRYLKGDGTNFVTSSGSASGVGACAANNFASTLNSDAAPTCTRPVLGDINGGTAPAAAFDFTSATSVKIPNSGGAAPTTSALLAYDTTLNAFAFGDNGSTYYVPISLHAVGSSDSCTAACTFATTVSVPNTLQVGSIIDADFHGVYTTTSGSPLYKFQINAGGTSNFLANQNTTALSINQTNASWDIPFTCMVTATGNPGTAICRAQAIVERSDSPALATQGGFINNATGGNYITTSAQTLSLQETGTLVAGQSYTLQWIRVTVQP